VLAIIYINSLNGWRVAKYWDKARSIFIYLYGLNSAAIDRVQIDVLLTTFCRSKHREKVTVKHKFHNIPEELKKRPQWVDWVYEHNPSDPDNPKKPPINPKTGKKAKVNDPDTFATFEVAVKRYKKGGVEGIGFVFTDNDPYVGIDLDDCRNKITGKIKIAAQLIIDSFASYTEISPSGTGIHIIAKGKLPGKGRNFGYVKSFGKVEMYDQAHYFTITGDIL